MANILRNFTTIRRTRGDIMNPARFRSSVEMIRGIIAKYDLAGFNVVYQGFLRHLADHNDPHKDATIDFLPEILERTYAIYVQMTATPVSESVFQSDIVPSLDFLELIRRIVLNRYVYDQIKLPDGSVPATAAVLLGHEWGHNANPNVPVTIGFGQVLGNEEAFLARGWGTNSTPIPVVFNADDLTHPYKNSHILFHTSLATPMFVPNNQSSSYTTALFSSSNDLSVDLRVKAAPVTKTVLVTLSNGVQTLAVAMKPDRTIELVWGSTVVVTDLPCNEGALSLHLSRTGLINLVTSHNGLSTAHPYNLNFTSVAPFSAATIGVSLESHFTALFGLRDLTIYQDTYLSA